MRSLLVLLASLIPVLSSSIPWQKRITKIENNGDDGGPTVFSSNGRLPAVEKKLAQATEQSTRIVVVIVCQDGKLVASTVPASPYLYVDDDGDNDTHPPLSGYSTAGKVRYITAGAPLDSLLLQDILHRIDEDNPAAVVARILADQLQEATQTTRNTHPVLAVSIHMSMRNTQTHRLLTRV